MNKLFFWVCAVLMTACASHKNDEVLTESGLSKSRFQTEINGEKTDLFILKNKNKMEVCITNYGGRIVSVMVPDKDGIMRDVVLGFDSIQDYIKYPFFVKLLYYISWQKVLYFNYLYISDCKKNNF